MEFSPRKSLTKRQRLLFRWGITTLILAVLLAILILTGILNPASKTGKMPSGTEEITSVLTREAPIEARFQFSPVEKSGIEFRHFPATRNSLLPEAGETTTMTVIRTCSWSILRAPLCRERIRCSPAGMRCTAMMVAAASAM
jgi:hypothetical protein